MPTVQQDDWMQAICGEVLQDNINNQEDNQEELVQDDDHDPDYSELVTDPNFNCDEDKDYLGIQYGHKMLQTGWNVRR